MQTGVNDFEVSRTPRAVRRKGCLLRLAAPEERTRTMTFFSCSHCEARIDAVIRVLTAISLTLACLAMAVSSAGQQTTAIVLGGVAVLLSSLGILVALVLGRRRALGYSALALLLSMLPVIGGAVHISGIFERSAATGGSFVTSTNALLQWSDDDRKALIASANGDIATANALSTRKSELAIEWESRMRQIDENRRRRQEGVKGAEPPVSN